MAKRRRNSKGQFVATKRRTRRRPTIWRKVRSRIERRIGARLW